MKANALNFTMKPALDSNLSQLKTEFSMYGVSAVDPAEYTISKFANEPIETQKLIIDNISTYLQILAQNINPEPEKKNYEIERLKWALSTFGLELADKDFFKNISEDDYVEFYNEQNIQLYRSVKFFKLCSYSLLDLSVNPWDELYEKPVGVMSNVIQHIQEAIKSKITVTCEIGSFVQREKFAYAHNTTLRTFLVNFRYFTPLINTDTKQPAGFLCTFGAEVIAEGQQSSKYRVI